MRHSLFALVPRFCYRKQESSLKSEEGAATAKPQVSIIDVLNRTLTLLSKKSKAEKAGNLLVGLLKKHLTAENKDQIFQVLKEHFGAAEQTSEEWGLPQYQKVFETLEQSVEFTEEEMEWIKAWKLKLVTVRELQTDDSYRFNKAMKFLDAAVKAWSASEDELSLEKKRQSINCLRQAFKLRNLAWAKPSLNVTMKAAAERRLCLPENLREELDAWSNAHRQDGKAKKPTILIGSTFNVHPLHTVGNKGSVVLQHASQTKQKK